MNIKREAYLKTVVFCLFFLALSTAAYCGQLNRIELADGTVINGELTSYANGVYTIRSSGLGEIKVEASNVSKIETLSSPLMGTSPLQVQDYKQKLMSDPGNAAVISGLGSDSRIQELAQDPQIIKASETGDIQELMKNEKFMSIVNDPRIQEEIKKIKQQSSIQ